MRLSLFARLPKAPRRAPDASWMLARLVDRRYAGIDVPVEDVSPELAMQLRDHQLRTVVRVATEPSGSDDTPEARIDELARGLDAAAAIGQVVSHVVVDPLVTATPWSSEQALAYLHGALPLGAALLEAQPHIGASSRETDAFGGRPVHLHGVSHSCRQADWGMSLPVSETTDVYPIMRLSLDTRKSSAHLGGFGEHEHCDHLTLHPTRTALGMSTSYWMHVRRVFEVKLHRDAPEALVSVPQLVALQEGRATGLAEARLFENLVLDARHGLGMGSAPPGQERRPGHRRSKGADDKGRWLTRRATRRRKAWNE